MSIKNGIGGGKLWSAKPNGNNSIQLKLPLTNSYYGISQAKDSLIDLTRGKGERV